ncbi:MAG: ribonuclease PH [Verrucomicrobiales bacterium]|nr:ribonuclease PH [Verrucomicrobiales bacterium]
MTRPDGRAPDQLRPVSFLPNIAPNATGSVLACFGNTKVICTVMIEDSVPRWMKEQGMTGGWLTAEYAMLPGSTLDRKARDSSKGRIDGRSTEIQRLIGRALRAVVDLQALGQKTVWVDCDVLQADGGTRTAAITGACVACALAFNKLQAERRISRAPLRRLVAAVSAGICDEQPVLDLNYVEDKDASVDFNFVMTEDLDFVEFQGAGEESTFSEDQMNAMLQLGRKGIADVARAQHEAISAGEGVPDADALASLARMFAK